LPFRAAQDFPNRLATIAPMSFYQEDSAAQRRCPSADH
jgi:hypothetical protein